MGTDLLRFSTLLALALALTPAAIGCGAGQYGYAREYEPLGDEDDLIEAEQPASYEEVKRDPNAFRSQLIGWFGVVTAVAAGENGEAQVAMTHRVHQDRHLCADETAGSCRVTVSERQSGPFTALIRLRPEDAAGHEDRVWIGSLIKVYGSPTGDFDAEGGPVLRARWYRHWPRGYYRTTAARGLMRR